MLPREVFVLALSGAIGCASNRAPGTTTAVRVEAPPDAAAPRIAPGADAAITDDALPKRARSVCPEGSVWTGKLCHGPGFDACPPGMHLDAELCTAAEALVPAKIATVRKPKPPAKDRLAEAEEEEPEEPIASIATGVPECDRFLLRYTSCTALPAQTRNAVDGLVRAWRTMGKDPKQRASMQATCSQMEQTLKGACP